MSAPARAALLRRAGSLVPAALKRRLRWRLGVPEHERTLRVMRRAGFAPRTAVDVGAYEGEWTLLCRRVFPRTQVLMVEPQRAKRARLDEVARALGGVRVESALLGARERAEVSFFENETVSSVLVESEGAARPAVPHAMRTLVQITAGTPFARPDLVKLDVQGYELEVLRGGEEVLAAAQAVVMEVSLIEVNEGAPLLDEVIAFMAARDFRAYDVCALVRRPLDDALWQLDLAFVRRDSPLATSKRWG